MAASAIVIYQFWFRYRPNVWQVILYKQVMIVIACCIYIVQMWWKYVNRQASLHGGGKYDTGLNVGNKVARF